MRFPTNFIPASAGGFFTLEEKFGSLKGLKLAYVGDGNNVCNSLIFLAARLGVNLRIATPASYAPGRTCLPTPSACERDSRED